MVHQTGTKRYRQYGGFIRSLMVLVACLGAIATYEAKPVVSQAKSSSNTKDAKESKSEKKQPSQTKQETWNGKAEYAGDETCKMCHEDVYTKWQKTRHGQTLTHAGVIKKGQTCETCHGPGSEHPGDDNHKKIWNPAKLKAKDAVKRCLPCHDSTVKTVEWIASTHGQNNLGCNQCHDIHKPTKTNALLKQEGSELCLSCHKKQRAEFHRNSHHPVLEGRIQCLDCHNPHKPDQIGRRFKATGENQCLKCHQQLKGPFVFEHDPMVSGLTEACLACHQPHGSPNPKLTKMFGRGLCLQCHSDKVAHAPGGAQAQKCWDVGCHVGVHGSNQASRLPIPLSK